MTATPAVPPSSSSKRQEDKEEVAAPVEPPPPPWKSSRLVQQNRRVFHQILEKTGTHSGLFRYIQAMPCWWPVESAANKRPRGGEGGGEGGGDNSSSCMKSPDTKRRRTGQDEEVKKEETMEQQEKGQGGGALPAGGGLVSPATTMHAATEVSCEERYMAVVEALCQQLQEMCHSNKKLKQSFGEEAFNNFPNSFNSSSRKRKKPTTASCLFGGQSFASSEVIDLDGDSTNASSPSGPSSTADCSSSNVSPSRADNNNNVNNVNNNVNNMVAHEIITAALATVACQTDVPAVAAVVAGDTPPATPPATPPVQVSSSSLCFFGLDLFFVHIFFYAHDPKLIACPCETTDAVLRILNLQPTAGEAEITARYTFLFQQIDIFWKQQGSHQLPSYVPSDLVFSWYYRWKADGVVVAAQDRDTTVLRGAATALMQLVECGRELRDRVAFWASHIEDSLSRSGRTCDLNELLMIPIGTQTREQVKEKYATAMEALAAGGGGDDEAMTTSEGETTSQTASSFNGRLRRVRAALKAARKVWDDIEAEAAAKRAQQDSEREESRLRHEEQRSQKLNVQWNYVSFITKYRRFVAPAATPLNNVAAPPAPLTYADAIDKWGGNADKLSSDPRIQPFVILGLNPLMYRNMAQKDVLRQIGNGKKKLSLFLHPDKCSGSMGGSEELSSQASAIYSTMTTACEMCMTLIQTGGYLSKQKGSPSPFADLFGQPPCAMSFPQGGGGHLLLLLRGALKVVVVLVVVVEVRRRRVAAAMPPAAAQMAQLAPPPLAQPATATYGRMVCTWSTLPPSRRSR
eukprot:GHVS01101546.1.p1 GENE.GHVS01101546.1~~GHVS01101546.1.p1  ORF type:complete len:808 (+),score=213.22 GHVS01101546.1:23-2425(+)